MILYFRTVYNTMKSKYPYLLALVFLSIWACGTSDAEEPIDIQGGPEIHSASVISGELAYYQEHVEDFVDSMLGKSSFTGGILIAKNGNILFERYYGYTNPRKKAEPINASTPIHLASVSKPLTALGILKFVQEGKLNLDDSAYNYLPGFPLKNITIKSLLNHRSGLPNYAHYMDQMGWDRNRLMTNKDILDFINERHAEIPLWRPEMKFSYSNTNYALLALIIENLSGQTYADYMRLSVFEPLGMKNTFVYQPSDSLKALSSYYYNGREFPFDFLDLVYGDKNIYSTPTDLLKFEQMINSGSVISDELRNVAFQGYSYERKGINNYGLGWRLIEFNHGKKMVYHQGWWHGSRTAIYMLPDENVTIIALCNNNYKPVYNLRLIADVFGNYFNKGPVVQFD